MPLPPGPRTIPLVGDPQMFGQDSIQYIFDLYEQYGNLVTIHFGPVPMVIMRGPKYNHYILSENAANFLSRPATAMMEGPMFGEGVLVIDGDVHKQARRMMQPAFHRKRVETYFDAMVTETQRVIDTFSGEIDISRVMHHLTLNIVARVLFSADISQDSHHLSQVWDHFNTRGGDPVGAVLARIPFSDRRVALREMNAILTDLIAAHRADNRDQDDVVSMLIEAKDEDGTVFSDTEIRDHLLTLFFAGHETSANALTWTFYILAQHPEWARRVVNEIAQVLGGNAPTSSALDNMPTLDMVIKESMRLMPPVLGFIRTSAAPFEMDGYQIPADTTVMYTIMATHYLPELYPEPLEFRPERFAANAERKYSLYEYLPFGGGARMCLGMSMAMLEIKIILAMTLQKWRLDLVPDQTVQAMFRGTMYPRDGIQMRVHPQDGQTECSPARVHGNVIGAVDGRQVGQTISSQRPV